MKFITPISAAAAVLAGAGTLAAPAAAKTITLRIGSGHPSKPTPHVRQIEHHVVPMVTGHAAKETKHKVRFIQADAGKVAKVHETLEAVEKGLLDIGG